jgi:hypothetical protein
MVKMRWIRTLRTLVITLTVLALACSGCFQQRVKTRGASGIVLDKDTQAPVNNAQVAVSEYYDDNLNASNALKAIRKPATNTDTYGSFSIPPQYKTLLLAMGDYWAPPASLVIQRAGYATSVYPLSGEVTTNMIFTNNQMYYLIAPEKPSQTRR